MDEACFSLSRLRKRPRRPGPRLAAIDAEPKPFAETPDEKWAQIKANKKKVLRETWSNRAAVIDQVNMEVDGEGGDHDPYLPLLQALQAEMVEHEQFINKQSALYIANKYNWGKSFSASYGLPLGIKVDARYEYWPACKEKLPLLHYCARMLFAGSKASTCSNERLHSVSGRITTKLRRSLLPGSVEQLTLAYHYIKKKVKEMTINMGAEAVAILDEEDVLEERCDAVTQ